MPLSLSSPCHEARPAVGSARFLLAVVQPRDMSIVDFSNFARLSSIRSPLSTNCPTTKKLGGVETVEGEGLWFGRGFRRETLDHALGGRQGAPPFGRTPMLDARLRRCCH